MEYSELTKAQVLDLIFRTHGLDRSDEGLRALWINDLSHFTVDEIRSAYDEWRKDDRNMYVKPQPAMLAARIRKKRQSTGVKKLTHHSTTLEAKIPEHLVSMMDRMKKNNPNVFVEIAQAKTPKDKIMIGLKALNKPDLINSPFGRALTNMEF